MASRCLLQSLGHGCYKRPCPIQKMHLHHNPETSLHPAVGKGTASRSCARQDQSGGTYGATAATASEKEAVSGQQPLQTEQDLDLLPGMQATCVWEVHR